MLLSLAACGSGGPANDSAAADPVALSTPQASPAAPAVPHVIDDAKLLGGAQAAALDARLGAFEKRTSQRMLVVIPATLGGRSSDEFVEAVGARLDVRNGAILLVAPREREVRIAVTNASRNLLTTKEAERIVGKMRPDLHANRYGPAIEQGTAQILAELSETLV